MFAKTNTAIVDEYVIYSYNTIQTSKVYTTFVKMIIIHCIT